MRTRRQSPEQQQVISRRLASLSAELTQQNHRDASDLVEKVSAPQWQLADPELAAALRPWDPQGAPNYAVEAPKAAPVISPPSLPGRHAARRRSGWNLWLLPVGRQQRFAFGPSQVSVVAVLVAAGLIATAWWAIASRPQPVKMPTSVTSTLASAEPLTQVEPSVETVADLVVDVSGKVRRPGIAVLAPGSRVVDAIRAAGGLRRGADLGLLNLARPLVDGEQILVGVPQPAGVGAAAAAPPSSSSGVAAPGALVNINTAGQVELETLPGVGPVTAQAIIAWRAEHNGFGAVEELLDVQGIGDATLAELAPHVTV